MRNPLLSVSLWFLQRILPNTIKDDLSGDLEEEYTKHILPEKGRFQANFWLIKQTFSTCSHYTFTFSNGLALLIALICISVFFLLMGAVSWLSYSPVTELSNSLWNGNEWSIESPQHKLLFEPALWQYLTEYYQHIFAINPLGLWIDSRAVFYSVCALFFITKTNKFNLLTIKAYILLAITLMFIPYIWGTYLFLSNDLSPAQTGPILATMWLTILYMILPTGYQLIRKITVENSVNNNA